MKNYYCEKCENLQNVTVEKMTRTFNVKGVNIKASIYIYKCVTCGEEVWDEENEKKNEKIVFSAYRLKMHLLQPEEIKKIRKMYNLSQSLFSKLLGFGAKTITRYENGSIQDISHDNLIRLLESSDNLIKLWENRKDFLTDQEKEIMKKILPTSNKRKYKTSYIPSITYTTKLKCNDNSLYYEGDLKYAN
ncbi:MAG: type II toxin-antitoxin system MqsA family antitoxin [Clostridia bacterium]